MKHLYLFFISAFSFGQTIPKEKIKNDVYYEFGLNSFSLTDAQTDVFLGNHFSSKNSNIKNYKGDFQTHYVPGFFVKRSSNNNLFRFSLDYTKNKYDEHHGYGTWGEALNGELQLYEYKLGYEREFGRKKIISVR